MVCLIAAASSAASASDRVRRGAEFSSSPIVSASIDHAEHALRNGSPPTVAAYSNISASSFLGGLLSHGDTLTLDDLVPLADGGMLESLSFTVANGGDTGNYTGGRVRIVLAPTQPGFTPGPAVLDIVLDLQTLFGGQLSVPPNSVTALTLNGFGSLGIVLPDGPYFAGLAFLDAGGAESLAVLGQGIFDPPSIGSSSDAVLFGTSTLSLGGPALSLGWQIGIVSDAIVGDYVFDRVPVPSVDLQTFKGGLAINDFGQLAVHFEDESGDPHYYLGNAREGRVFTPVETSSSANLGPVSMNRSGDAHYCVPFTNAGAARGVYRMAVASGGSTLATATTPAHNNPVLFARNDGGLSGKAFLSGAGLITGRRIIHIPGPQSPPIILAQERAADPSSDIQEISVFATAANNAGQILQYVTLVAGGAQYRLYEPDGSFVVVASDRAADPASPLATLEFIITPGLNDLGQAVLAGKNDLGRTELYKFENGLLSPLLTGSDLARIGVLFFSFQDLDLNNSGQFAFFSNPLYLGQDAGNSLFLADLDGSVTELFRTTSLPPSQLSTIDGESYPIESISEDIKVNERGELLFIGGDFSGAGIDDIVFLARPRALAECPVDLAPPFGLVNFEDIRAFIDSYLLEDPLLDSVEPFGVLNFNDLRAFLDAYVNGCP